MVPGLVLNTMSHDGTTSRVKILCYMTVPRLVLKYYVK